MKLLPKFVAVCSTLFIVGYLLAGAFAWRQLNASARDEVLAQAHVLTTYASAVRTYTDQQIVPTAPSNRNGVFRSQWIPFYAATQVFAYARANFPGFTYKEAALNPTNPRDRAESWEADVIDAFRNNPGMNRYESDRETPLGPSLVEATPIVSTASCLSCHGTPAAAPAGMVKLYGASNGFHWNNGEIIGAEIVSVPLSVATTAAWSAFVKLMIGLAIVAVVIVATLSFLLRMIIVAPINIIAREAEAASEGRLDGPEIVSEAKDEIGVLTRSFNRMTRSLRKALNLLESGS